MTNFKNKRCLLTCEIITNEFHIEHINIEATTVSILKLQDEKTYIHPIASIRMVFETGHYVLTERT